MIINVLLIPLFIGATELLLISGIALLLFGGKKLPEMMRGLGQGVNEFKRGMNETKTTNKETKTENGGVTSNKIQPDITVEDTDGKEK